MQAGNLTFEDVRKNMAYLKAEEFTIEKEHEILGFSREELMSLEGWRIVGLFETGGDTLCAFVCMFERNSDNTQAWCQVPFRYIEKQINASNQRP